MSHTKIVRGFAKMQKDLLVSGNGNHSLAGLYEEAQSHFRSTKIFMMIVFALQMCMDCYSGDRTICKGSKMPSAKALKSAVVDFFQIPSELWPAGFRVAFKTLDTREKIHQTARDLLSACVEVGTLLMP